MSKLKSSTRIVPGNCSFVDYYVPKENTGCSKENLNESRHSGEEKIGFKCFTKSQIAFTQPTNKKQLQLQLQKPIKPKYEYERHIVQKNISPTFETMDDISNLNLRIEVMLPEYEDVCEWYAANIEDFYLELTLLYDLCREDAARFLKAGEGFPSGFSHVFTDGNIKADPETCSSPFYVECVLTWVDKMIETFPEPDIGGFNEEFPILARQIINHILRVFAIVYSSHYEILSELDAARQLNTTFKRFIFFSMEFDLLDKDEICSLQCPIDHLRREFVQSRVNML